MIRLRDYQLKSIEDIRNAYRQGFKAPLFQAPTGAGKTAILAYIAAGSAAKKQNICILVHRQELVTQTSLALARAEVQHNICASPSVTKAAIKTQITECGRSLYRDEAHVLVASVQTLVRRMHEYPAFDLILIDEAHHGVAGTWLKIIESYPNARLLGVTATPERLDGRGLGVSCGGIYDALILGPSVQSLIDNGFLSRPRVFAPPSQLDLAGIKLIAGDYSKGELAKRVNKIQIIGDAVSHYRRLCHNVPAIAFCVSVEHAHQVAEQFCLAGYKAACIDGTMDDYRRRAVIEALSSGNLHVLTSCEIVSEGTDIPVVGAAILLRPTKSLGLYLQQVGRALRPYEGKKCAIILDHVGNVAQHGFPEEVREWSLGGRARRKRKADESNFSQYRQCMKCYSIFPTNVDICPQCGSVVQKSKQEIQQIQAELVEMENERVKSELRAERGKAQTLEELTAFAKKMGYKPGWAEHVYNSRRRKGTQ